jgi:hypothetical protein
VLPALQAIIVAIDQYAQAATSNRDFFLNKPYRAKVGRRSSKSISPQDHVRQFESLRVSAA